MTQNHGSQKKLKELVKEPTLNCPFFGSCLKKLAGSLKSFKNPRPPVISLPKKKFLQRPGTGDSYQG